MSHLDFLDLIRDLRREWEHAEEVWHALGDLADAVEADLIPHQWLATRYRSRSVRTLDSI